jgi:hypothetical protein
MVSDLDVKDYPYPLILRLVQPGQDILKPGHGLVRFTKCAPPLDGFPVAVADLLVYTKASLARGILII